MAIEQSIGQRIVTPIRRDPLGLLQSLKTDFPSASREAQLDLIRNHIGDEAYGRYKRSTEDLVKLVEHDAALQARKAITAQLADYGPPLRTSFRVCPSRKPFNDPIGRLNAKLDSHTAALQSLMEAFRQPIGQVQQVAARSVGSAQPADDRLQQLLDNMNRLFDAPTTTVRHSQAPSPIKKIRFEMH